MVQKIAIIGSGNVGGALHRGLARAGYEVRNSRKETVKETANWGEVVMIAVPYTAIDAVLHELAGAIDGKVVVDVTNALTQDMGWHWVFQPAARKRCKGKPRRRVSSKPSIPSLHNIWIPAACWGSSSPCLPQAMTSKPAAWRWILAGQSDSMRSMQVPLPTRGGLRH